tara:strand:- start:1802 stop:2215 length:414 start_codon:yes stop_codon:yes gene_type:complete
MAWPSNIDYSGSFSRRFDNENVTTTFASGRSRVRRYGNRNNDLCSVEMNLTDNQYFSFKSFYEGEANYGQNTYTGPYYVGNTKINGLLRIVGGSFKAAYLAPNRWVISFDFEVLYRNFTEEQVVYNAVVANGGFPLP